MDYAQLSKGKGLADEEGPARSVRVGATTKLKGTGKPRGQTRAASSQQPMQPVVLPEPEAVAATYVLRVVAAPSSALHSFIHLGPPSFVPRCRRNPARQAREAREATRKPRTVAAYKCKFTFFEVGK